MLCDNLLSLRKLNRLTQEEVAEKVGVSRQAVAKWESGESVPDIQKCAMLAQLYSVSLDELVQLPGAVKRSRMPPKGKHIFGVVTIGDRGQIIIPQKARTIFDLHSGDRLVVLGDEAQGLAMVKERGLLEILNVARNIPQEENK